MRARVGRWLLAVAGPLLVAGCAPEASQESAAPKPSETPVVVYLVDTLRADRTGPYGYGRAITPALDALAAEGVVFEQAYAPAPWTLPSVPSIMTSTFPCEHGVIVDGDRLAPALVPLAERLRATGRPTAAFYANPFVGPMSGLDRGYEHLVEGRTIDGRTIEDWLRAHAEKPFLLYVHTVEPHDPWFAPRRLVRRFDATAQRYKRRLEYLVDRYRRATRADFVAGFRPGTTDTTVLQEALLDDLNALVQPAHVLYDAAVAHADENLASVVATLRRLGLWERALVVLLSDHGEEMGDHGGWLHSQSVYEEVVRVPLIVKLPGGRRAGTRVREPVSLVDVAPTILELLELSDLAGGFRGRSLVAALDGVEAGLPRAPRVPAMRLNRKKDMGPFQRRRGDVNVAVRDGDLKAIWNADPDTIELYDLAQDPAERHDLARRRADDAGRLREHARQWLATCRPVPGAADAPPAGTIPEDVRDRLRELGYVD